MKDTHYPHIDERRHFWTSSNLQEYIGSALNKGSAVTNVSCHSCSQSDRKHSFINDNGFIDSLVRIHYSSIVTFSTWKTFSSVKLLDVRNKDLLDKCKADIGSVVDFTRIS